MRRIWVPLIAVVVLLATGAALAWGVGDTLGLSSAPAEVPAERSVAAPAAEAAPPPVIGAISVPEVTRLNLAAAAVADALVLRGAPRPLISPDPLAATGLRVIVGAMPTPGPAERFRLGRDAGGIVIEAGTLAGAAKGLYTVADRIRSGSEIDVGDTTLQPRLGLRLVDAGSVGREPNAAVFAAGTDYSLNTDVVGGALLPAAPWVDRVAVERISAQFRQFVEHSLARGYNGVVLPGFLEYVTFAGLGVHPPGDAHAARAEALVAAFGPVFRQAHDLGMKVYLLTDMLAVSPPLESYLRRRHGGLKVEDPAFWRIYQAGLTELFDALPFVDGLMIRVGEGGAVYSQPGWDYSSRIAVTSPAAVRTMLRAFLDTSAGAGKDLIFRTWTVGVGAVGDLHTNPASYDEVLDGFTDPNLIVSTKYTLGDFYSHLPFNTTLDGGRHRRIVELQARREFEGFGVLPNDLTGLHQQALRRFLAANPRVEGIWTWTQDGGPLRAGPMTLYLRNGFWQLYDLNVYTAARLAWDPEVPAARLTADWVRQTFTTDPATVAAICEMFAMSRSAVTKGLYISAYADRSVRALGLEPPPMMWIFEWDVVTGDSAALHSVYKVARDAGSIDDAVAEGQEAVALAGRMRAAIAGTDPATWRDPVLRAQLVDTLTYQADLFGVLGAYRTMILRNAQWLDTGSGAAETAWRDAAGRYRAARDAHVARYGGDVGLPAYNFTAADLGAARSGRDPAMAWAARALLALLFVCLIALPAGRALLRGAVRPWRPLADPTRLDRLLVLLIPALALAAGRLIHTRFAAPAHVLVVVAAWLLFALVVRFLVRGRDPFQLWAVLGGVAVLRTVILLAVLVRRGPGGYWFAFWTDPPVRFAYVCVAFAAFGWLFVAVWLVLRDRYGLSRGRATTGVLAAAGVPLAVLGGYVWAVGLERSLTVWNDQLALLPWGLSRILGITVHLGIPSSLPAVVTVAGVLLAVPLLAAAGWRRLRPV